MRQRRIGAMLNAFQDVPHLRAWMTLAYLLYLLWLIVWVMLQKRDPVATVGWILALAALPYIGLLVYYLLGPQRIRRQRQRWVRTRAQVPEPRDDSAARADVRSRRLSHMVQRSTGIPPSSAAAVTWLVDGAATYQALLLAIAQAKKHVHLEYYIFHPDQTGTRVRDALVQKAREGIKVRLLLDAIGSYAAKTAFLQPLLDAGGEVAWFHPSRPLRWLRLQRPWINMRSHRKIVVIDADVAFTGGLNVTDQENEAITPSAYRDLHMQLRGNIVRSIQQVFIEDWLYASRQTRAMVEDEHLWPHDAIAGKIHAQALISGPDSAWETIHRAHISAIQRARKRIWLVTPYFVPSEAALFALTSAALGGVEVRLLVPRMSDSVMVTLAARSYYDTLLAAGVNIYEYGPRILHTKALLIDDDMCIVGTANFDWRSFRLNFEISMLLRDQATALALASFLQQEFTPAMRVKPMGRSLPLYRRIPEAFARLFSPLF